MTKGIKMFNSAEPWMCIGIKFSQLYAIFNMPLTSFIIIIMSLIGFITFFLCNKEIT